MFQPPSNRHPTGLAVLQAPGLAILQDCLSICYLKATAFLVVPTVIDIVFYEYSHSSKTMDASTPAQEEPAQAPSTNSPPPMDSRNDSVEHDESAPLLEADDMASPNRNTSSKVFYIVTSMALSSSALTLIFIIAAFIAVEVDKNSYGLSWQVSESMRSMIAPVFTTSNSQSCC